MMLTTLHAQSWQGWMGDWLRDLKPQWAKIVNPPSGFVVPNVANTLVRLWTDNIDAGYIAGGRQGGRDFVRSMYPQWQRNPATAYELANEPDCNTNQGLANLREYTLGAIEQAVQLGIRLCVLNIAEGNPHDNGANDPGVSAWKLAQLRPAVVAAQQAGMYVGLHAYWRPGVEGPTGRWHALGRVEWTLQQWGVPGLKALVNEWGIDGGIAGGPGGTGWQRLTSEMLYRDWLAEGEAYARRIPGLEALMIFGFGATDKWLAGGFDVPESFARSLVAPLQAVSVPPVVPPPVTPLEVVMAIVNTGKAWYSADSLFGPYDVHPQRARDWNLESMGNTDLGEPVQAPFEGDVVFASDAGGKHGKVVIVAGIVGGELTCWHWKHADQITTRIWAHVKPGTRVCTVGTAGGQYAAHGHEEFCIGAITGPTQDWRDPAFEYVDPAEWYKAHGVDAALLDRLTRYDGR